MPANLVKVKRFRCTEIYSMVHVLNLKDHFPDRILISREKWILYDNHKRSAHRLDYDAAQTRFKCEIAPTEDLDICLVNCYLRHSRQLSGI